MEKGLSAIPLPNEVENCYPIPARDSGGSSGLPSFLRNLKQEDIILLAVIILLMIEGGNDKILIGILFFLFISGLDGNLLGL